MVFQPLGKTGCIENQAANGHSTATTLIFLHRRTARVAIGTIDTAVSGQRTQGLATSFAIIKKLTGIHGHFLCFGMTAIWAAYR